MTLQIKERIVGIIVVVCLALIWGPFFLSKKSSDNTEPKNNQTAANQQNPAVVKPAPEQQQLVESTLPPQTQEEQVQPKQTPVLPMPVTQQQAAVEDDDIAPGPSDVTLQWSGKENTKVAANQAQTRPQYNEQPKQLAEEEQALPPVSAQENTPAPSHAAEELNDEKLVKTSEANEAKLQKLFEKNEHVAAKTKPATAKVPAAKSMVKNSGSKKQVAATQKKAADVKVATNAKWIVEVATLSNPHYAALLKQKLAKNGFSAYSRVGHSNSGNSIYYVWIGAENNREQAEALARRLQQTSHMAGKVSKSSNV